MARKITPHYTTGTLAKYEQDTPKGKLVHSVTTSTRGPGYTVASFLHGFVDPRSIQTFMDRDEALAECKRRAQGDEPEKLVLTDTAARILALAEDPEDDAARATLESLGQAWEYHFQAGDDQLADRIAAVLAALTMRSRS